MGARPRPVTATFPPPPLLSPIHFRPTSCSPSPLNSTASLLSVLNHKSYESIPNQAICNEEDDEDKTYCSLNENDESYATHFGSQAENNCNVQNTCWDKDIIQSAALDRNATTLIGSNSRRRSVVIIPNKSCMQRSSSSADALQRNAKDSVNASRKNDFFEIGSSQKEVKDSRNEMSAWERWIVEKAKQDRTRTEEEIERQKKLRDAEEKARNEKEDKKKKAEKVIQDWIKDYDLRKKQELSKELQKSQEKEEQKQKEKEKISEKAKAKYDEWLHKKAEEDTKKKKEMMEKKEKELLEKENRQKKSEEAFNNWCKKAQSRPRTAPNSFGYTDGKLTGYYDFGAYPTPSYINPLPWQPIEVPKPKLIRSKKKQNVRRQKYRMTNYYM